MSPASALTLSVDDCALPEKAIGSAVTTMFLDGQLIDFRVPVAPAECSSTGNSPVTRRREMTSRFRVGVNVSAIWPVVT